MKVNPPSQSQYPHPPPSLLTNTFSIQILATQSATLTNYEVLTHLTSTRAKSSLRQTADPKTSSMKSPNLETVTKEVRSFSPCPALLLFLHPLHPPSYTPPQPPPLSSQFAPIAHRLPVACLLFHEQRPPTPPSPLRHRLHPHHHPHAPHVSARLRPDKSGTADDSESTSDGYGVLGLCD